MYLLELGDVYTVIICNYGDLRSSYVIICWFGFDTIVHISPTTLLKFPCLPILWLSGPGWSLCRLCQLFLCIRAAAFSGGWWWWDLPVAMHTEAFRIITDYIKIIRNFHSEKSSHGKSREILCHVVFPTDCPVHHDPKHSICFRLGMPPSICHCFTITGRWGLACALVGLPVAATHASTYASGALSFCLGIVLPDEPKGDWRRPAFKIDSVI